MKVRQSVRICNMGQWVCVILPDYYANLNSAPQRIKVPNELVSYFLWASTYKLNALQGTLVLTISITSFHTFPSNFPSIWTKSCFRSDLIIFTASKRHWLSTITLQFLFIFSLLLFSISQFLSMFSYFKDFPLHENRVF